MNEPPACPKLVAGQQRVCTADSARPTRRWPIAPRERYLQEGRLVMKNYIAAIYKDRDSCYGSVIPDVPRFSPRQPVKKLYEQHLHHQAELGDGRTGADSGAPGSSAHTIWYNRHEDRNASICPRWRVSAGFAHNQRHDRRPWVRGACH